MTTHPRVVVMGVSGSGKSTVGTALAIALGVPFADGDDLHSPENLAKMRSGVPLTDADRAPWLDAVGQWLAAEPAGGVMACSALRAAYRRVIADFCPGVFFVHLDGPIELVSDRAGTRAGHFMPVGLVPSQYAALEPLGPHESGVTVSIDRPVEEVVAAVRQALSGT